MKKVDSAWSRFLVVPFVLCLGYGYVGAFCQCPLSREALAVSIGIMAGFVSACANYWPDQKPIYKADWLVTPLLVGFVATVMTHATGCSPWMLVVLPLLMVAGYSSADPNFGREVQYFLEERVVLPVVCPLIFAYVLCDCTVAHIVANRAKIAFRMHFVCAIGSALLMFVGWFTADVRLVAIGLGYSLGIVTASEFNVSGLTRTWLALSLVVSIFALTGRIQGINFVDPMYAVIAGFVALILSTLERTYAQTVSTGPGDSPIYTHAPCCPR